MLEQEVKIKSPIKLIPSENYLLVIEDADGVRHYWHGEHENKYAQFECGEYDGWSKEIKGNITLVEKPN